MNGKGKHGLRKKNPLFKQSVYMSLRTTINANMTVHIIQRLKHHPYQRRPPGRERGQERESEGFKYKTWKRL